MKIKMEWDQNPKDYFGDGEQYKNRDVFYQIEYDNTPKDIKMLLMQ